MPIKVLVATRAGQRDGDTFGCREGELVRLASDETADLFAGFETRLCTSTALVVERDLDRLTYQALFIGAALRAGFGLDGEQLRQEADQLLQVAAQFQPGDILELRGETVAVRLNRPSDTGEKQ